MNSSYNNNNNSNNIYYYNYSSSSSSSFFFFSSSSSSPPRPFASQQRLGLIPIEFYVRPTNTYDRCSLARIVGQKQPSRAVVRGRSLRLYRRAHVYGEAAARATRELRRQPHNTSGGPSAHSRTTKPRPSINISIIDLFFLVNSDNFGPISRLMNTSARGRPAAFSGS